MTLPYVLRRVRYWASGRAVDAGATPVRAADLVGHDERERVLAQARVHGVVAAELSRVMQGKLAEREDLCRQLRQRPEISELSAAWLRLRIEELDRLITQQLATVDWHLRESRRLEQGIQ